MFRALRFRRAHTAIALGILLLMALSGTFAPAAVAAPFTELPVPAIAATEMRAGDSVILRWPSLAGKAEELELVFSLDDGSHFDIRVSPQLAGGESRYLWRVPNLGVRGGRLKLRARVDGKELSGPESQAFRIIPNPMRAPDLWIYRSGEWWADRGGVPFGMPGLVTPPRAPMLHADVSPGTLVAISVRTPEVSLPLQASEPALVGVQATQAITIPSAATTQPFRPMRT